MIQYSDEVEEEAEERKLRGLPPLPEVPADTQTEPMP